MAMIIFLSIILILLTLLLHQAALTFFARRMLMGARKSQLRLYFLMLGIFAAHLLEILLYSLGFYAATNIFDLGVLQGDRAVGALGYFYTSAVFYTSLGFGDVLPNDHLRFMAVVEALNGLLLIAWSASFLFNAMGQFWSCLTNSCTDDPSVARNETDA